MVPNYIPYQQIADHLNIREGSTLLVAGDVTRLALFASKNEGEFEVNLLIDSLLKKLGNKGTLLIQAFNHDIASGGSFDIRKTKPRTGALALAAFERDDFVRTRHPLHSFMVWGKDAAFYEGLSNSSSFAFDSPFAFLKDKAAGMLFISSSVKRALSYTHYVEEAEKVRYRKYRSLMIRYTDKEGEDGLREYSIYAKKRGWTLDFVPLEEKFRKAGILNEQMINGLLFQLLPLDDAFYLIRDDIRNNRSKRIAYFSPELFFKELLKDYLYRLRIFRTTSDKIKYGSNL